MDYLTRLGRRFESQRVFAAAYSPLVAAVWGALVDWCQRPDDPLIVWLVAASTGRKPFDVTLLLLAGLHREVLLGETAVADLARFYPSVGGAFEPGRDEPALREALRTAILARRDALTEFIQTKTVQTNETGRGIAWLLPLLESGWTAVHVVDLGASAGLNLVAEQRAFRLFAAEQGPGEWVDVGLGQPVQFEVRVDGLGQRLPPDGERSLPRILSRTGCDLHPFGLETAVDEATLAAYIWPDQLERLARLREGIGAFGAVARSDGAVALHAVRLPNDLPAFLRETIPHDSHPVLLYSTYITMYLPERGRLLREHVAAWAAVQKRPVWWVQWEPVQHLALPGAQEPAYGWLAWVVDQWENGVYRRDHIGWTHPHGRDIQILPAERP